MSFSERYLAEDHWRIIFTFLPFQTLIHLSLINRSFHMQLGTPTTPHTHLNQLFFNALTRPYEDMLAIRNSLPFSIRKTCKGDDDVRKAVVEVFIRQYKLMKMICPIVDEDIGAKPHSSFSGHIEDDDGMDDRYGGDTLHNILGAPLEFERSLKNPSFSGYPSTMSPPIFPLDLTIYLRYHAHILSFFLPRIPRSGLACFWDDSLAPSDTDLYDFVPSSWNGGFCKSRHGSIQVFIPIFRQHVFVFTAVGATYNTTRTCLIDCTPPPFKEENEQYGAAYTMIYREDDEPRLMDLGNSWTDYLTELLQHAMRDEDARKAFDESLLNETLW
ncbi:hypothetical protein DFJ77DRAFT_440956 [Powellomyces hirtus]|nr:hypothetical protein DFJ77DRAFT_440956 [Powellomyces hirtus]